jgi:hypothetical protein
MRMSVSNEADSFAFDVKNVVQEESRECPANSTNL